MSPSGTVIFNRLFREAYQRCFGIPFESPVSESESRQMANDILEKTGLIIGWKSIKNYSAYILDQASVKQENPSVSTLDTFARYVMDAPRTDEAERKATESHFPYWFRYRSGQAGDDSKGKTIGMNTRGVYIISGMILAVAGVLFYIFLYRSKPSVFTDTFRSLGDDSLLSHGWLVQDPDTIFWNRRTQSPGFLTLFTLEGDNWPDSAHTPGIKNLLLRKVNSGCFTAEVHLEEFIPEENWQQAGILLLEDRDFSGKGFRFSVAYNDFTGGAPKTRDILIQAISSMGGRFIKPEEIVHQHLFDLDKDAPDFVRTNMKHCALRIEKRGPHIRLLFSSGSFENSAFKEIADRDLEMDPAYIGLFALRGYVKNSGALPARFSFFSLSDNPCK